MRNHTIKTMFTAVALTSTVSAGSLDGPKLETTATSGDFCRRIEDLGVLYKNKENRYIQKVAITGRFHAQYAYIDGTDANGDDFNQDFEEIRRLRAGIEIRAFHNFELSANANFEDDRNREGLPRVLGYEDFDKVKLSYRMENVLGLDSLKFTYGRLKVNVGQEAHTSSKRIKTVERSALSNKISMNRYTGFMVSGKKNAVKGTVGVLSLDASDFIGNWAAGKALYGSAEFDAMGGDLTLDFFYNLDQGTTKDQVGVDYEWVSSASWQGQVGGWDLAVNAVVGDNGSDPKATREGVFYGLVVMPSKYIIEDKLEFVTRYQFQESDESEGVRLNSRYLRNADIKANGRGKSHHSIYAGLNYFLCGDNAKVMAGVEYETLDDVKGDIDATTFWAAYRMHF